MGRLPEMREHAPCSNVVIVSMNTGPSSRFALTDITEKDFNFLIDSGASRGVISRNFCDSLPEPRSSIKNTTTKFRVANGSVNKATGICHLPVTLTVGTLVTTICLPVFICDFLSPNVNCDFCIDAGRALSMFYAMTLVPSDA